MIILNKSCNNCCSCITYTVIYSAKPNLYFDRLPWGPFKVSVAYVYMIWRSFYSNETVKCSWSDSASSSGDVVHVLMSSFSETADAEVTASITGFSMCVCSKWNRTSVSFINRDAEHAGFIFKVFLRLNIYIYQSIAWVDLSVLTYFWLIHPNFDTFRDIPRYTVNSIIWLHSAIPPAFSASRTS